MAQLSAAPQTAAISLKRSRCRGVFRHHDERLRGAAQHGGELGDRGEAGGQLVRVRPSTARSRCRAASPAARPSPRRRRACRCGGLGRRARARRCSPSRCRSTRRPTRAAGAALSPREASSRCAAPGPEPRRPARRGMRTREPSTRAPALPSRASAFSCCTSTPVALEHGESRLVDLGAATLVERDGAESVLRHVVPPGRQPVGHRSVAEGRRGPGADMPRRVRSARLPFPVRSGR